MMTGGILPFTEANKARDESYCLICDNLDYLFWLKHEEEGFIFTPEFKDLIICMFQPSPQARMISISDILGHPWLEGEASELEVATEFKRRKNPACFDNYSIYKNK